MTKKIKLSTDARRLLSALTEAERNDPEGARFVRESVMEELETLKDSEARLQVIKERLLVPQTQKLDLPLSEGALDEIAELIHRAGRPTTGKSFAHLRREARECGGNGYGGKDF